MAEAKLMLEWDLMSSLQFQIAAIMAKDKAAVKKMKIEDFHPLRQKMIKHVKQDAKETWAMFKKAFDKKAK